MSRLLNDRNRHRASAADFMDYDGDKKDVNRHNSRSTSPPTRRKHEDDNNYRDTRDRGYEGRGERGVRGPGRYQDDYYGSRRGDTRLAADEFGRSRDWHRDSHRRRSRSRSQDSRRRSRSGSPGRDRRIDEKDKRDDGNTRQSVKRGRDHHTDKQERGQKGTGASSDPVSQKDPISQSEPEDPEELMRKMMGFSGFSTTKDKKVIGANVSGVAKVKSSGFRQYMNRSEGFNRDLSPPHE